MKTLEFIECKRCGGSYYSGKTDVTLIAGTEKHAPDEVEFIILKIDKCDNCKKRDPRMLNR